MADIKASEIAGELRKGERLYEVFAEASRIARFFVDLEQKEAALKKSIKELELEAAQTDEGINAKVEVANKRLAETKLLAELAGKDAQKVKEEANEILARAKNTATLIVEKAKNEALQVAESVDQLRKEKAGLETLNYGLKRASDEMVKEMHAKRDALLKAFS